MDRIPPAGTLDTIGFTTVAQRQHDGPKTANEAVIRCHAEYTAFFEGSTPDTPNINWEVELIAAVALGERRTGGYSVEITQIALHTIGINAGTVEISYVERIPEDGAPDVLTYPYHAVKFRRVGIRYFFRNVTNDTPSMDDLPPALFKHWLRIPEQETDNVQVYRPSEHSFPLSRGRSGFEIKAGGEWIQYDIGPNDAPQPVPGRWHQAGAQRLRVDLEGEAQRSMTLTIVSVDDQVLRVIQE